MPGKGILSLFANFTCKLTGNQSFPACALVPSLMSDCNLWCTERIVYRCFQTLFVLQCSPSKPQRVNLLHLKWWKRTAAVLFHPHKQISDAKNYLLRPLCVRKHFVWTFERTSGSRTALGSFFNPKFESTVCPEFHIQVPNFLWPLEKACRQVDWQL